MRLEQIDHIGIAVRDIDRALELYRDRLGLEPGLRKRVEDQKVEVQFLELPGTKLELLAPLAADSPISRFLRQPMPPVICCTRAFSTARSRRRSG